MKPRRHNVSVLIGGQRIDRWTSYDIETNMLSLCDDFSLELAPADAELFAICKLDSQVQVFIDNVRILSGFIGERSYTKTREGGGVLRISGRDRSGRLVDESMPIDAQIGKLDVKGLCEKAAGEWFSEVRFSNAENRARARGGRAELARAWAEPSTAGEVAAKQAQLPKYSKPRVKSLDGEPVVHEDPRETRLVRRNDLGVEQSSFSKGGAVVPGHLTQEHQPRPPRDPGSLFEREKAHAKVEPGQTRADVLRSVLEPAHMLCWSTADGKALVIGTPNYDQEAQYQFFVPGSSASPRRGFANTLEFELVDSVEDRYSQITVIGAVANLDWLDVDERRRGNSSSAVAQQGPGPEGTGDDFQYPKRLIVPDDEVKGARDALSRAHREMAVRDKARRTLSILVDGHGQRYNRDSPAEAIYAFDCVADVLEEGIDVGGRYLITSCRFTSNADDGEQTQLMLVPVGTELSR